MLRPERTRCRKSVLLSSITAASLGISAISPHNPVLMGDLMFVSWYQAGLQVFDISDPVNPLHVGAYDTFDIDGPFSEFDGNWGVYPLLGLDKVLLSDTEGGLFIVDASAVVPIPAAVYLFASGFLVLVSTAKPLNVTSVAVVWLRSMMTVSV